MSAPTLAVIGVDPGPIPGVCVIRPDTAPAVVQCSASLIAPVLDSISGGDLRVLLAVEKFVVGPRSARSSSPKAGEITRRMVGELEALATARYLGAVFRDRPAADVKRWATDERLERAGLAEITKGMRHARDAARHTLYAACADAGYPDPATREGRTFWKGLDR